MKVIFALAISIVGFVFVSCAILEPIESRTFKDLSSYKYAVVAQSSTISSGVGGAYIGYGTGGGAAYSVSKSVNPSDIIAGILMKKGFVIVDSVPKDKESETLIVKFGQGDKRNVLGGIGGYTLSANIQMLESKSQDVVFTCNAEGQGETEADDIRVAITRCLSALQ